MPLVVGTGLALGGLMLVLWPLMGDQSGLARDTEREAKRAARRAQSPPEEASDGAVAALREIEFDRATGKLSDLDYAELKTRYTSAALAELRAQVPAATIATGDVSSLSAVENAIRRAKANQRSCAVCGPRTEADATYCSSCGSYLPGACKRCGAQVELEGSRFCSSCGEQLAAA